MSGIPISYPIILKSLWFSCVSLSQTFERTVESQEKVINHAWRIFTGKLGELLFIEYLIKNKIVSEEFYTKFCNDSLSIFWGKTNVDRFDLLINNYTIDVKTLPERTHRFLIIPEDQFTQQPKDFYVCVRLIHNLEDEVKKVKFLNKTCFEIYELLKLSNGLNITGENIFKDIHISGEILGFVERNSPLLEYHNLDAICPEKDCYRVEIKKLRKIEDLFFILLPSAGNSPL